jgi:hypothetical protein
LRLCCLCRALQRYLPSIAWLKFAALAEGTCLATKQLWQKDIASSFSMQSLAIARSRRVADCRRTETEKEKHVNQNEIDVISPLGLPATQNKAIAPRLDSLVGKTIGEVYNHHFKGDQMFGIVPYTDLPASFVGGDSAYHRRIAQEVAARAREKGCDALITGNGG